MSRSSPSVVLAALSGLLGAGALRAAPPICRISFDEGAGVVAHGRGSSDGVLVGGDGPVWVRGRLGGALRWDYPAAQQHNWGVVIPYSPAFDCTSGMSVLAWVYLPAGCMSSNLEPRPHGILRKGDVFQLAIFEHTLYCEVKTNSPLYGGPRWRLTRGATILEENTWYQVAMTLDSGADGDPADITTLTGLRPLAGESLALAGCDDPHGYCSNDCDEHIREIGNVLATPDDPDAPYKMWYTGYCGTYNNLVTITPHWVHMATSPDGITWSKLGRIQFSNGVDHHLEDPYVVIVDGTYYMFAEDKDFGSSNFSPGIRRLHSADGFHWADDGLILARGTAPWEAQDVGSPLMWVEQGVWYLYYEGRGSGNPGSIGLATSTDGMNFYRYGTTPRMAPGTGCDDWDNGSIIPDDLVSLNGSYYMTYHASPSDPCHGRRRSTTTTGLAISNDLITWTRYAANPIDYHATVMMLNEGGAVTFFAEEPATTSFAAGVRRCRPVRANAPRLYINGVEEHYHVREDCENQALLTDNRQITIGNGVGLWFEGLIDDVQLFAAPLLPHEVAALYANPGQDILRGDMNCDGLVNNFDIDTFVTALLAPADYLAAFPNCNLLAGDINRDDALNNFDIAPFAECVLRVGCQ